MNAPADRAAELRALLQHHAHQYYVLDAPQIPDAVRPAVPGTAGDRGRASRTAHARFADAARRRRRADGLLPVRHALPMLSIRTETDTTAEGARAFDARVRRELALPPDAPLVDTTPS